MEKKSFNLFYFVILISGVLYTNVCFSQNTPTTWQDRLEALKNSFNEENRGDVSFLKLLGYTYKGIIGSQTVKSDIIDSLLSYNAPAFAFTSHSDERYCIKGRFLRHSGKSVA